MQSLQFQRFSRRHLPWLLWLVLLLPLAQTAATWHMLSHAQPDPLEDGSGGKAIHLANCDLCLSAAALIGGAPLTQSPVAPALIERHEAPLAALRDGLSTPTPLAYNSRAPPLLLH